MTGEAYSVHQQLLHELQQGRPVSAQVRADFTLTMDLDSTEEQARDNAGALLSGAGIGQPGFQVVAQKVSVAAPPEPEPDDAFEYWRGTLELEVELDPGAGLDLLAALGAVAGKISAADALSLDSDVELS